jgi:hypothetical protein
VKVNDHKSSPEADSFINGLCSHILWKESLNIDMGQQFN